MITTVGKILAVGAVLISTPALSDQYYQYNRCTNCRVYQNPPVRQVEVETPYALNGRGIVTGSNVWMPVGPTVVVEEPVAVPVPAPAPRVGPCALYVDPYDLFGQLFGDPDLVESCWVR